MFRRRYGSMVDSEFLIRNLLLCCFFGNSFCDVTSFSLEAGTDSLSGESASLICTLDRYTNTINIFKSDGKFNVGTALSTCDETKCRIREGYDVTVTGTTVKVTIKNLQRAEHQKWWTCRTIISQAQSSQKQFQLTVYTVPSSITLNGPTETCDLGKSRCEYTCSTDQCTFPLPTFTWLYIVADGTTKVISHTTSTTYTSTNCADGTKIYNDTLIFPQYKLYTGNTPKTVRLQCNITFTDLSSGRCTSTLSQAVIFAVKVSTVQIFDGTNELTGSTLIVVNKEKTLLQCNPGNGNPTPTVQWFIGTSRASTESQFWFIPDNAHHGLRIYCVADNIPDDTNDAVSNNPVLYVKVKIQFVYVEPAADTIISVIENTQEPAVCTTSPGRPGSTIKWYRNTIELVEGASTDFERTDNNLNVTKSTRYIKVLRSDSGWKLSCAASNFEGASPIWANNSKQLNVLYPPEHMRLFFDGKPVTGPVVDVIRGSHGTLKCTASSNPPVSVFSWNVNQKLGDALTIDDNIQNGQIVNCTASNIMTPTTGITKNGVGSIAKIINLRYGPLIERIEVNGNMGSTWVIKENESISIACYVDSNPDSHISLLQGINRLKEKEEGVVLVYNISSAQCSHTSEYTCNAENGINKVQQPATRTVQINVECSPRLAIDTEPYAFAQENTSAVLSLTILAYPIPTKYDWHRITLNGWKILNNNQSIRMTQESLQFNLTFTSVKPEDYGEYILTVYYTDDVPFNFTGVLKADEEPEPYTYQPGATTAGIAGGVVGGLLLVCVIIVIVVCIIRRRNGFDDFKTKLFGKTSAASCEEIQPQETGYSYAAVEKPTGESALNIIDSANAETKLDEESTPASGYLYSEVNNSGRDKSMKIIKDNKASESTGVKNKAKKTKAVSETTNEGSCYENPTVLTESDVKVKPQKKGKPAKPKDKQQVSQSHDGLQYVELSFSDTKKKGKKTKPTQPKAEERTVYDAVQFGVVGAAHTSNGEENDSKK